MEVMITFGTAAQTADREFLRGSVPAALVLDIASDFAGAETIPAYYVGADNTRLTPVLDADGNAFALSLTNKVLPVYFPCKIRLVKPESVAGMGVNIFGN